MELVSGESDKGSLEFVVAWAPKYLVYAPPCLDVATSKRSSHHSCIQPCGALPSVGSVTVAQLRP